MFYDNKNTRLTDHLETASNSTAFLNISEPKQTGGSSPPSQKRALVHVLIAFGLKNPEAYQAQARSQWAALDFAAGVHWDPLLRRCIEASIAKAKDPKRIRKSGFGSLPSFGGMEMREMRDRRDR